MASSSEKKNSAVGKIIIGFVAVAVCIAVCWFLISSIMNLFGGSGTTSADTKNEAEPAATAMIFDPQVKDDMPVYDMPVETVKPDTESGDWTDDGTGLSFNEIDSGADGYEDGMSVNE